MRTDGRIVVDAASYFHAKPDEQKNLDALDSASIAPQVNVSDEKHIDSIPYRCGTGRMRESERRERSRQRKIENGELPVEKSKPSE